MLGLLIKKQIREVCSFLYYDTKKNRRRTGASLVVNIIVLSVVFLLVAFMFAAIATWIGADMLLMGFGWLYFLIMGMLAIVLGVFGSVFNTYASVYLAKDNEAIISMPIKPGHILISRLSGVYLLGTVYMALVYIPSMVVSFVFGKFSIGMLIGEIVMFVVLSLIVLMLSAILGWVVAAISMKLKNKSFITVFIALAFIALYYYFYFKVMNGINDILEKLLLFGDVVKSKWVAVYYVGQAFMGDAIPLIVCVVVAAALNVLVYWILMRSFIKITTTKRGEKKVAYDAAKVKATPLENALFKKEQRRFTRSATYMLNCGLGAIFIVISAIAILIKGDVFAEVLINELGLNSIQITLIASVFVALMSTMTDISAPSISLEGNTLWILQTLPIKPIKILAAKVRFHATVSILPIIIFIVALCGALDLDEVSIILLTVIGVAFMMTFAIYGVVLNLKSPNLRWNNETTALKNSLPVFVCIFGGWAYLLIFVGLYFLLGRVFGDIGYLIFVSIVLILVDILGIVWLNKKGSRIFRYLS